jgi:hypothetical protein
MPMDRGPLELNRDEQTSWLSRKFDDKEWILSDPRVSDFLCKWPVDHLG